MARSDRCDAARHGRDGLAAPRVEPGQQRGRRRRRARPAGCCCRPGAHSAATSCGVRQRRRRAGSCWRRGPGASGVEVATSRAQLTQLGRGQAGQVVERTAATSRPAASSRTAASSAAVGAVTTTRRPSATQRGDGVGDSVRGVESSRTTRALPRIGRDDEPASSPGVRGSGGARRRRRRDASARLAQPGRGGRRRRWRAPDLRPGLRRGLVRARGGEAVDEDGEIGVARRRGAVDRSDIQHYVHLRLPTPWSATVTLRIAVIYRMLHPGRAIRQSPCAPNGHPTAPAGHSDEWGHDHRSARHAAINGAPCTGLSGDRSAPVHERSIPLVDAVRRTLFRSGRGGRRRPTGRLPGAAARSPRRRGSRPGGWRPSPSATLRGPQDQGDHHRDHQVDHQRHEADVDLHRRAGERVPAERPSACPAPAPSRRSARLPVAGFGMSVEQVRGP